MNDRRVRTPYSGAPRGRKKGTAQPRPSSLLVQATPAQVEYIRLAYGKGRLVPTLARELNMPRNAVDAAVRKLRRVGLLGEKPGVDETVLALYRYLGRTPSRILGLSLADAVGEMRTQNQPGTDDEYPNWRIPLGGPDGRRLLLEEVFTDPRAAALCQALRAAVNPQM